MQKTLVSSIVIAFAIVSQGSSSDTETALQLTGTDGIINTNTLLPTTILNITNTQSDIPSITATTTRPTTNQLTPTPTPAPNNSSGSIGNNTISYSGTGGKNDALYSSMFVGGALMFVAMIAFTL